MKRIALAVALSLVIGLTLLPGAAWAQQRHQAFSAGCCVFIRPVNPFFHQQFAHPGFVHRGFTQAPFGSTFIVVNPASQLVWVPGFWWWNGFQWVWAPGHWAW